jgi:membrane-associated protein
MDLIKQFIDFFIHLDTHLAEIISKYGTGTYVILFLIIFAETGLVVMPLLPGDSLLFAAGIFARLGDLNPWLLTGLLIVAAILGDTVNYWVGKRIGPKAFTSDSRFFKRAYLDRTRGFYARHGGKTIILARFVPIVRTFAPFVAGVGEMHYGRFLAYNVIGGVVWVTLLVWAGYLFGEIPIVRENFELVIFAIIGISVLPIVIEVFRGWKTRRSETT